MKYYSEKLKKIYDSEEELLGAEKDEEIRIENEKREIALKQEQKAKKDSERQARAKIVEAAYGAVADIRKEYNKKFSELKEEYQKKISDAQKQADALRKEFVRDYGAFYYTFSTFPSAFDDFFKLFIDF